MRLLIPFFIAFLAASLKCYATWEDSEAGNKRDDLIECPVYEKGGGKHELPKACGEWTETGRTNFYCAYESVMKQHGVPKGRGCAKDIVGEDGMPRSIEICYCVKDGCNKNCSCSSENLDTAPKSNADPPTNEHASNLGSTLHSSTTVQSAEFFGTSQPGTASFIEALGLILEMIMFSTIARKLISEL